MPSKLAYYNCTGYAQSIRLMLAYVGEDCDEKRYKFSPLPNFMENWLPDKYTLGLDFPNLPYYNDGKVNISQTHAILRYLDIKYDLEPKSVDERVRVAVADEQMKDFFSALVKMCYNSQKEDRDKLTESFLEEQLPPKLKQWEAFLGDRPWLSGQNICYVDFAFYHYLQTHTLLKKDLLQDYPNLDGYMKRFENLPNVKEYLVSGKCIKHPNMGPKAELLS